jgi:hypothetical protein
MEYYLVPNNVPKKDRKKKAWDEAFPWLVKLWALIIVGYILLHLI